MTDASGLVRGESSTDPDPWDLSPKPLDQQTVHKLTALVDRVADCGDTTAQDLADALIGNLRSVGYDDDEILKIIAARLIETVQEFEAVCAGCAMRMNGDPTETAILWLDDWYAEGRWAFYWGDHPEWFAKQMMDDFGIDVHHPDRLGRDPWSTKWSDYEGPMRRFFIPAGFVGVVLRYYGEALGG